MIEAPQPAAPVSEKMSFMDAVTRDVQKYFPLFEHEGEQGRLDGKVVVAFETNNAGETRPVFVKSASVAVAMGAKLKLFERMQKVFDIKQWCDKDDQAVLAYLIVERLYGLDSLAGSADA